MSAPEPAAPRSGGGMAGAIVLGVMALFVWFIQLATLSDLTGSDPAGNGLTEVFAALEVIILWALLTGLTILACVKGRLPMPAVIATLVSIPVSWFAAMAAMDLLRFTREPPFLWPIIVSAVVPPLLVLFGLWAVVPPLRAAVPVRIAAALVCGTTFIVSLSIWPMSRIHQAVILHHQAERDTWAIDFARVPANSPLWDWTPFLDTPDDTRVSAVLGRIRALDRRQSDAETMLDRGDFPLGQLAQMDLTPTPEICHRARALLRRKLQPLILKTGETKPYADIRGDVWNAVAAMTWLVGYGCPCDAESLAWETMAKAYQDPEYSIYELRDLRDPAALGKILREDPARFSMLSRQSHLKAWLHFAEDKSLHDQALAGARKVDDRTDQAVEILTGDQYGAWDLLIYLPVLDLDATPELCGAALREVHRELAPIYRPSGDNPVPYQDLLMRLGTGEPLRALIWLTQHGCDTGTEVDEATALVTAYQDSPERTAMLAGLRLKP